MAEELDENNDIPGQVKEEEDYDSGDDDKSESEFSDSDEDEGDSDTGLTENQNRLLYLISLYIHTRPRQKRKRKNGYDGRHLWFFCYEGIVAQVLDYDYAPASYLVQGRRKYFNTTQEGNSDIDFLREEELINGLKLSSTEYKPVTCYQVSQKGLELMRQLSKADKEAVGMNWSMHQVLVARKVYFVFTGMEMSIGSKQRALADARLSRRLKMCLMSQVHIPHSVYVKVVGQHFQMHIAPTSVIQERVTLQMNLTKL